MAEIGIISARNFLSSCNHGIESGGKTSIGDDQINIFRCGDTAFTFSSILSVKLFRRLAKDDAGRLRSIKIKKKKTQHAGSVEAVAALDEVGL